MMISKYFGHLAKHSYIMWCKVVSSAGKCVWSFGHRERIERSLVEVNDFTMIHISYVYRINAFSFESIRWVSVSCSNIIIALFMCAQTYFGIIIYNDYSLWSNSVLLHRMNTAKLNNLTSDRKYSNTFNFHILSMNITKLMKRTATSHLVTEQDLRITQKNKI